jgi:hypothetical protein
MIEPKIMAYVKANVPLVSNRVEFVDAPAKTLRPYITFAEIVPGRVYTHDGYAKISRIGYRFNVFADDYVTAKETAQELIEAMEAWYADGIQGAFLATKNDLKLSDTSLYHVAMTFMINYKE